MRPVDSKGAINHFADPDFDGEPVQIYEPGKGGPMLPPLKTILAEALAR